MTTYKYNTDTLLYDKVNTLPKTLKLITISFVSSFLILLICSFNYIREKEKRIITDETTINLITNNSFSKGSFIKEVNSCNFQYPDIIIAQAYIESTYFTSPVFKENNNMFGMRLAKQRLTLSKYDNLNHAIFNTWKDCVKDRLIYEALYLNNLSKEQYYAYLDKVYARAGGISYSTLIKQVIKKHKL